jgi:hypothetical protein
MVDGAALPSSVLTLSHWPQSPTARLLWRDLSTASVLDYLRLCRGELPLRLRDRVAAASIVRAAEGVEVVTNDHFDEDGLMSVLALIDPGFALERADLLVAIARTGDFGVVASEEAARIAFAIVPLASGEAGPRASAGERYLAALSRVGELVEHSERFEQMWGEQLLELKAGFEALGQGAVTIEELGQDLAVVRRVRFGGPLAGKGTGGGRLPGAHGGFPIHQAAINTTTTATCLVGFDDSRCEVLMRYEGWVRFVSRPVARRPDLGPLAAELASLEPGGIRWEADGPSATLPRCRPEGEGLTEIDPGAVVDCVRRYFATAPAVWDPYRAQ